MAKKFYVTFGSGDPRTYTGLTPTMIIFANENGASITAPGITEIVAGSGYYQFTYGPTISCIFLMDGGSGVDTTVRYVPGVLDPITSVDEKVGTTDDSFGSTAIDPTTLMGFAKRNLEVQEGDAVFTKSTGAWGVSSRGSSTLLFEKTLTNTSTESTKS